MKNIVIIGVVSLIVFIISCSSHNPNGPYPAPTPCTVGDLSFSPLNYGSTLSAGVNNYIITSQDVYLSNYVCYEPAGTPVPTPVPVDFSKKMVIGFPSFIGCGIGTWALTTITADCKTATADILKTYNSCIMTECDFILEITYWYVIDKTSLPLEVQTTLFDTCKGTTTTSTAPFNVTYTSVGVGTFIKTTTTTSPI